MEEKYKQIYKICVDISTNAHQAEILFKTIEEYEINSEITVLSELGRKICNQIREYTAKFEFTMDEIKDLILK